MDGQKTTYRTTHDRQTVSFHNAHVWAYYFKNRCGDMWDEMIEMGDEIGFRFLSEEWDSNHWMFHREVA